MAKPLNPDPELRAFATPRQLEYFDAVKKHGGIHAAARALKVDASSVSYAMNRLKASAALRGYAPDHDMTRPVPDGFKVRGVSTLYDKDGKQAAQWVKSTADEARQQEMMRAAFASMAQELPRAKAVPAPAHTIDALCNLVVFSDYHLGMLAWHKEGGADWDLKIAESMLTASFLHMVEAAPKARSCVLCLQGDFLHTDGLVPVTNANHNVLDADGRYPKIIAAAIRVIRQLVARALAHHRVVRLIIMQGNHDENGSLWMSQMFAALYENEPRLAVDDSVLPFYVHQHGKTMLAFHHGHKVSNEALPLLFAAQHPKMWGDTVKRYCHTGHRHHVDEKEYAGMIVSQHPTLAARDAYAARGGWIAERAAVAVTYHTEFGQVAKSYVCSEMFE